MPAVAIPPAPLDFATQPKIRPKMAKSKDKTQIQQKIKDKTPMSREATAAACPAAGRIGGKSGAVGGVGRGLLIIGIRRRLLGRHRGRGRRLFSRRWYRRGWGNGGLLILGSLIPWNIGGLIVIGSRATVVGRRTVVWNRTFLSPGRNSDRHRTSCFSLRLDSPEFARQIRVQYNR